MRKENKSNYKEYLLVIGCLFIMNHVGSFSRHKGTVMIIDLFDIYVVVFSILFLLFSIFFYIKGEKGVSKNFFITFACIFATTSVVINTNEKNYDRHRPILYVSENFTIFTPLFLKYSKYDSIEKANFNIKSGTTIDEFNIQVIEHKNKYRGFNLFEMLTFDKIIKSAYENKNQKLVNYLIQLSIKNKNFFENRKLLIEDIINYKDIENAKYVPARRLVYKLDEKMFKNKDNNDFSMALIKDKDIHIKERLYFISIANKVNNKEMVDFLTKME